jgi:progressive ankylosis protein
MIDFQLARFLFPLALTLVVQGLSSQVLSGGMARVPRSTEILAAYGLAWGLTELFSSPLSQVRQVGLVLAESRQALRRIRVFVLWAGLSLSGVLALLALSPLGDWVIEGLHGVAPALGALVRQALLGFIPIPLLDAWNRLYSGLLLQVRRTEIVSGATLANIGASIAAVFLLLPVPLVQTHPILLPVLVVYAGALADLGVLSWGYYRYVRLTLPRETEKEPGYLYVLNFFWPLALVMAIQGLSRPLINLFVARGADGQQALAVLAVVYPLAHLPYGWVNEIRSLPVAFRQIAGSLVHIRRFSLGCGLFSFGLMVLMFWTPLRRIILAEWIAIEPVLVDPCAAPLVIFSFFPLAVMVRAYLHGVALLERRTWALAPSGPSRIGIILVALIALPAAGIRGATLGTTALLSGFVLEAGVVWWGLRGPGGKRRSG